MDTGPHEHQDCIVHQGRNIHQARDTHQGLNMHPDCALDQRRHLCRRPLIYP